ncbi:NAD(P)/FAD-dependent oxidoreductase [Salinarimonas rosea]|uniref:NAD(P)/FAD-dependent oxidoreductase n=1 Tax=Salinarimonas rosea TaxID=552063 RepID=UPI0004006DAB|nr:FAD-dependent oxidoreductase [Salinarimonas rosea]
MSGGVDGSDVLVVGGGLAGAACAIRLAEAGADVVLVEREAGAHDKVCGEFLSAEAAAMLEGLGLADVLAGSPAISRLALVHGARTAEAGLPFVARGLSRARLDEALLARAAAAGVDLRRGRAVRALARQGGRWSARLDGGDVATAARVVLATGKHDLRGHARPDPADPGLVGLKVRLALAPGAEARLEERIVLVLFDGGYAGLQRVEGGRANLCLVAPGGRLREAGGLPGLIAGIAAGTPALEALVADARLLGERPRAVGRIPYGFVHRPSSADPQALLRVGDQAGVVPSFCGDGMAMALYGGLAAANALVAGEDEGRHHARLAAAIGPAIGRARGLERLAAGGLGRAALVAGTRLAPAAAAGIAAATRVPETAWRAALGPRP